MRICTTTLTFIVLCAAMGCASRPAPEDVPGSLAAGDPSTVGSFSGGETQGSIKTLAVHPVTAWRQPSIPMVETPPVASIWVLPRESRDGKSLCDGFWIHTMLSEARWGLTQAMRNGAVPLRDATNMQANDAGELEMRVIVSDRTRSSFRQLRSATTRLPFSDAASSAMPAPASQAQPQPQVP